MNFASDTTAPVHPRILHAIAAANFGSAPSYGADEFTQRAEAAIRDLFETDCALFFVATGGAANGLALSALTPSWGCVLACAHAHILADEGNGPEFYTGGARTIGIPAEHGKLASARLAETIGQFPADFVHGPQPRTLSITQATESGTVYSEDEIWALAEIARLSGLAIHMDGARFANAVVRLGVSPADLTWRAGVDALSLGGSKNGALALEAVILFDPGGRNQRAATALPFLRKRAGQLIAKHRFFAAQMEAWLAEGLWLSLARHANDSADILAAGFAASGRMPIHPVEANEVFVRLTPAEAASLRDVGASFYPWSADGPDAYRFVTSWASSPEDTRLLLTALQNVDEVRRA